MLLVGIVKGQAPQLSTGFLRCSGHGCHRENGTCRIIIFQGITEQQLNKTRLLHSELVHAQLRRVGVVGQGEAKGARELVGERDQVLLGQVSKP